MHRILLIFCLALPLASCGGPGHFNGNPSNQPQRRSAGNADLEGPGAEEVIRQTRRDHQRREVLDRFPPHRDRRYYGNYN